MGGSTQTTTNTTQSAPTNPMVTSTMNSLLGGVQNAWAAGPSTYDRSLYTGIGNSTKEGWNKSLTAAMNQDYTGGVNGAINSFGRVARGDYLDEKDPAFERDLTRTLDETGADVNSFFGTNGRLGSTGHVEDLASSLGGVRDKALMGQREASRNRQVQAAGMMPSLYSASLLPGSTFGAVGAAQEADAQAIRQGEYDLFQRKNNAQTDLLAKLSSILAGTSAPGGTTTTASQTTPTTPWWQSALGLGLAFL